MVRGRLSLKRIQPENHPGGVQLTRPKIANQIFFKSAEHAQRPKNKFPEFGKGGWDFHVVITPVDRKSFMKSIS